jgi:hypothetical protein
MPIVKLLPVAFFLLLTVNHAYSQKQDSLQVKINWGVESKELQDFYRFENLDYFLINTQGAIIKGKYYKIILKEYWHKNLLRTDTLVNTRKMKMPLKAEELSFKLMSKKVEPDSVKLMLIFPNFMIGRKYKTTKANTYSLRDISNGKAIHHHISKPLTLFAYSLPYQDPKQPGWLLYCELSKEGIPPEKWGKKFNIEHYLTLDIVFE